jgi:hypothetical protein
MLAYRGYGIDPHPRLLTGGQWDVSATVKRSFANFDQEWPVCGASTFSTRTEAAEDCVLICKRLIDRMIAPSGALC